MIITLTAKFIVQIVNLVNRNVLILGRLKSASSQHTNKADMNIDTQRDATSNGVHRAETTKT